MSKKSVLPKFKVGDCVEGISPSHYTVTCKGWKGRVIAVFNNGNIRVSAGDSLSSYNVNPIHFRKLSDSQSKKIPLCTSFKNWDVGISSDNIYTFGCGAVKLSRSQILKYKRFLELSKDKDVIAIKRHIRHNESKGVKLSEIKNLLSVKGEK